MPGKKESNAQAKKENALLEERISANVVDYPKDFLLGVGAITSLLPAYLSHSVNDLDVTQLVNIPIFAVALGATAVMLSRAYCVMIESEFWKRQKHFQEVASESDAKLLRKLRLQVALGYSLFLINGLFFIMCSVFHLYLFRRTDPRVSLLLSPTLTSSILWLVSQKNEESRKRRLALHK
jgi:hypothetical protein